MGGVPAEEFPTNINNNYYYHCCPTGCGEHCGARTCNKAFGCCFDAAEFRICGDFDPPCMLASGGNFQFCYFLVFIHSL